MQNTEKKHLLIQLDRLADQTEIDLRYNAKILAQFSTDSAEFKKLNTINQKIHQLFQQIQNLFNSDASEGEITLRIAEYESVKASFERKYLDIKKTHFMSFLKRIGL